ncbi:FGGY-family carbohydrate kinase [Chachezhania antarctica]|uniref:FGGY-family carbohydrate kinase n=1 Tax=Chachezhania antarctica TaxID=2340860 RepID=UPI000EABF86D|nr:FGGY family carbohydrate kinase [Chachezhania antarctica]|tara:strand:- start:20139 stop:21590 length:1452 start_codon:yes stop_codon:yes gene_type:complete
MRVLTIDQGTTNTKALVIDGSGAILARASRSTQTEYPRPGWSQQSAHSIWDATRAVIDEAAMAAGPDSIDAIAIANQRETLVVWDAETSEPVTPAILWQCRRTAEDCAALIAEGHGPVVEAATGLAINPLFPASKLAWVLREVPEARTLLEAGRLRAGTVDAWLLWKLTDGASFATDHSNASRTQLFDTAALDWSADLARIFGAAADCLPQPRASDSHFGDTASGATALPAGVPIRAMMGDSHAALYGHGVRQPGTVKATYGTGSSLMVLTPERRQSRHGLSSTIAWSDRNGTAHALEGNITVSAQAAGFMSGLLGITDARALSDLAQTVPESGGVVFVPALSGLGAPHWNNDATGLVTGLTGGSTPAHLARATFEAIALQVADVFTAMEADIGAPVSGLLADGGASSNAFLMQLQADILQCDVRASVVEEIGAMGAARMAFAAAGAALETGDETIAYSCAADPAFARDLRAGWRAAVARCMQ